MGILSLHVESPKVISAPGQLPHRLTENPTCAARLVGRLGSLPTITRTDLLLGAIGIAVLAVWCSWWIGGLQAGQLKKSPTQWFSPFHFLGLDFLHNYQAARYWIEGGDPYREPFGDPLERKLCYPPIVLPFFTWCAAFSPRQAVIVWTVVLAGLAGIGAAACWGVRRQLGLASVPFPFALAAVLVSAPVVYAMERGNYDLLVVPLILGAAWALRNRSVGRDAFAGSCLALAACFKVYPALLLLALLPLGRLRAAVFAVIAAGLFASFQWEHVPACVTNIQELARTNSTERQGVLSPSGHSLTSGWKLLWEGTRLARLNQVPTVIAALVVFGPVLAWVGDRVYRCPDVGPLVLPLLLWVAALATFIPAVANDYSLVFLPLAALAVWDRRDPVPLQLGMAALVLWAQPLAFEVDPAVLLGLKVVSTLAVGGCLAVRLGEKTPTDQSPGGGPKCPVK